MKKSISRIAAPALAGVFLAAVSSASAQDEIKRKTSIRGYLETGHLVKGYNYYASAEQGLDTVISFLPLNRANVMVIQDFIAGNFDVSMGLSGLIWWPYGAGISANVSERVIQVKPMVPHARARWQFGDPHAMAASIMLGTFPYKYNMDAKNLGEYLYRSGTYPGMLFTGEGWLLMNRSGNYSHGLLGSLSHGGGLMKHNLSLFMETVYHPVGNFSPGYDASLNTKWLTLGAGAVYNHFFALRPSQVSPKKDENTFMEIRGKTAAGVDTVVSGRKDQFVLGQISPPATPEDTTLTRWTLKGVKLMGRASLNFGHLLPESVGGPEDLKFFTEIALLGVKDYPIYYTKKSERMPIMFGVNVPTFRLLDVLSLQGEIYKSKHSDVTKYVDEGLPIWQLGKDSARVSDDDFKWSVYAKRSVTKSFSVFFQAASDHFRMTDAAFNTSKIPLTYSSKDWYYLFRLEFNLK